MPFFLVGTHYALGLAPVLYPHHPANNSTTLHEDAEAQRGIVGL